MMTAAMTAPPCARKRPREDHTDPNLKTAEGHRTNVSLSFNSTVGLEPAASIHRGNKDSITQCQLMREKGGTRPLRLDSVPEHTTYNQQRIYRV